VNVKRKLPAMKRTKPKPRVYWAVERKPSVGPWEIEWVLDTYLSFGPHFGPLQILTRIDAREAVKALRSEGVRARVVKVQVLEPRSRKKRSSK
jgi:hypothetical protein